MGTGMISLHSSHRGFLGLILSGAVTVNIEATRDWRVSDFIREGRWDVEVLTAVFWPIDVEDIFRVPLGHNWAQDRLVWHFGSKGRDTVKSGYWVARK